jgi:hypothetical protein
LTPEKIEIAFIYLKNCIKQHDIKLVIDTVGEDKVIALIKELFPVIQAPLLELFNKGNVCQLFRRILRFISSIIKIGESKKKAGPNTQTNFTEEYSRVVDEFLNDVYNYLHQLASNDTGLAQDIISYIVEVLNLYSGGWVIDMHPLILSLQPDEREQLVREINAWEDWREQKDERKFRSLERIFDHDTAAKINVVEEIKPPEPVLTFTPRLKDTFTGMVTMGLGQRYLEIKEQNQ